MTSYQIMVATKGLGTPLTSEDKEISIEMLRTSATICNLGPLPPVNKLTLLILSHYTNISSHDSILMGHSL